VISGAMIGLRRFWRGQANAKNKGRMSIATFLSDTETFFHFSAREFR
jgi:hypothetical protein